MGFKCTGKFFSSLKSIAESGCKLSKLKTQASLPIPINGHFNDHFNGNLFIAFILFDNYKNTQDWMC